jgi:hypothetical protein
MVGFVRKPFDSPPAPAERFTEHLRATSSALSQTRTGLPRCAARAVEPAWNLSRCGAVSLTHLQRTLCMCGKMAAMKRAFPGGLALQAAGSRCR